MAHAPRCCVRDWRSATTGFTHSPHASYELTTHRLLRCRGERTSRVVRGLLIDRRSAASRKTIKHLYLFSSKVRKRNLPSDVPKLSKDIWCVVVRGNIKTT
eukprot:6185045-Pleurochrysis_carterae.AAC.1